MMRRTVNTMTKMGRAIMATKRKISDDRYRRYAEAKARIPKWLPPEQYESQIKALAKKYGV